MSTSSLVNESGGGEGEGGAEVVFEFDPGISPDGDNDDIIDNCSSEETEPQLNLNGYCFLCFEKDCAQSWMEAGGGIEEITGFTIKSFKTLLTNLTGEGVGAGEDKEDVRRLSVCVQCYQTLTELDKLHQEFLGIQRRIQSQVGKLRECVAKTVQIEEEDGGGDNFVGKSRRTKFFESLTNSSSNGEPVEEVNQVGRWLIKVHDQIITKDCAVNFAPPSSPQTDDEEHQLIKVIEVDNPEHQIDNEDNGRSSSPDNQKLQVEFITIEEYTDVQGHVYHVSQGGEEARIVEIPYQEEQVDTQMQMEESIENQAIPDPEHSDNQQDKQFCEGVANVDSSLEKPDDTSQLSDAGGDGDDDEDSSVTIAGVPVDPSANYVMITTNVTDPTTGVVSVQPILISVAQLQAMQHHQQPSLSIPSITIPPPALTPPPIIQPSGSGPKNKSSKKEPLGAYSTPSEYLYYHSDHQPCDVCNCHLPRGPQIASHLACHVGSDNVFYCSDCQLGFISPYRLAQYHRSRPTRCHQDNSIHTTPLYNCDLCPYSSSKPISFRKLSGVP